MKRRSGVAMIRERAEGHLSEYGKTSLNQLAAVSTKTRNVTKSRNVILDLMESERIIEDAQGLLDLSPRVREAIAEERMFNEVYPSMEEGQEDRLRF